MIIYVEIRSVYGNDLIYPVCDKAQALCRLLGTKTIPVDRIGPLKAMGITLTARAMEVVL